MDTEPDSPRASRRHTFAFLGAVFLHALAYFLLSPPWMGEDEPWHFEYVEHVSRGHLPGNWRKIPPTETGADPRTVHTTSHLQVLSRFPEISTEEIDLTEREIMRSMREQNWWQRVDWAGSETDTQNFDQVAKNFSAMPQPPPYYLLAGTWLRLFSFDDVEARLYAARALSLLIHLATALAGLAFARALFRDETLALCAAFLIAWFPMHARQAAVINNDLLANAFTAVVFWLGARHLTKSGGRFDPVWMLVLCGLCLFTKSSAFSGVIVTTIAVLLRSTGKKVGLLAAIFALVATASFLWLRNSPAVPKSFAKMFQRMEAGASWAVLEKTWTTWIASFNWHSRELPDTVYVVTAIVALAAAIGALVFLSRVDSSTLRRGVLFCFACVLCQYALIVLRGEGAGRYMMPALPAAAAIVTTGLVAIWPVERRRLALSALAIAVVLFDALFLWYGLVPNQYLLWNA